MHPKFYKLTLPEVIELGSVLRYAEFRVLLYLKTSHPLCTGPLDVDAEEIATAFNLDVRTVSRALKQLELKGYIGEVVVTRASITILPWGPVATSAAPLDGSGDPLDGSARPLGGSARPLGGSVDPLPTAETLETSLNLPPDQIKEFKDSSDRAREEEEDTQFSFKAMAVDYRNFLKKKAKQLPQPPNNLHGWIVAMAKRGVYLSEFEALQQTKNVPPPAPAEKEFSSAAEYFKFLNERGGNG